MHVETALFFETVEEIYVRVFRAMNPRTPVPPVSVRFRKYANANSKVRLTENELSVSISDMLQTAPAPVQEALAWILLGKLFRRALDQNPQTIYHRYLARPDVQERLQVVRQERGRKSIASPIGRHYNLREIFAHLNQKYFKDQLSEPLLGWSRRSSRTILGHYDSAHHAIVITNLLDSAWASRLLVEYVLFHEMLHIQHPTEQRGLRRRIHTKNFKDAEKCFEGYAEANRELRSLGKRSLENVSELKLTLC